MTAQQILNMVVFPLPIRKTANKLTHKLLITLFDIKILIFNVLNEFNQYEHYSIFYAQLRIPNDGLRGDDYMQSVM